MDCRKRIALVADGNKKFDLLERVRFNRGALSLEVESNHEHTKPTRAADYHDC